ncbi:MAG: BatD family protein [Bacteroidota bacterium]
MPLFKPIISISSIWSLVFRQKQARLWQADCCSLYSDSRLLSNRFPLLCENSLSNIKYQISNIQHPVLSIKYLILILLFFLSTTCLFAEDIKFTASASKNKVAVGEQFKVTFTLPASGSNFRPPPFEYFQILSGPNQSTNMQWINGKTSYSTTYSYILTPIKEGKYSIGSASITSDGKTLITNSINIDVIKGSAQTQSPSAKKTPNDQKIDDKLSLNVSVDKTKAYQGEQISVTYTLYFQVDIVGNEVSKLPALNGFWTQDVQMPQQAQVYTTNINGSRYNAADLKKTILFPQRSGNLEIDPMEFKCVVRTQTKSRQQSVFDWNPFGSYKDTEYIIKSKPVNITVLPLPSANQPGNFSGVVGKYTMKTDIDKTQLKANEAVNLNIKISGNGNLKLIDPLNISFPPDIENYEPKIVDKITTTSGGVSGSRTFEYLLIPRHAGEYTIEPIQFSYFDPEKKSYKILTSPEYKLMVEKGEEGVITTLSTINKENVKFIGSDIMFIKNLPFLIRKKGESFFLSANFLALYISPVLFLILFLLLRKRKIEQSKNVALMKKKKATRIARKSLSKAKSFLREEKNEQFYDETLKALWVYTSDKLSMPVSELSKDSIRQLLYKRNVNEQTVNQFISILNHCEFTRYAPSVNAKGMEKIYSDTLRTISNLEHELR